MVVRLLEWCGQYLTPLGLNEDTIRQAGGSQTDYLVLLAERQAYYCGSGLKPTETDDTENEDDDQSFYLTNQPDMV
jgi:hypothetical protein